MSSSTSNYASKNSSHDLMSYLSKKLLNKSKEINLLFNNLSSRLPNDSTIINTLQEVDLQLKHASYAIKAVLTENLALKEQIYNYQNKRTISTISLMSKSNQFSKSIRVSPNPNKEITDNYASDLMLEIVKYPNAILNLKRELGEDFMLKIMKRNIDLNYLDRVNDIIKENKDKGTIVKYSSSKFNIPLRIKMADEDKTNAQSKNKCAFSYSYENGCGSVSYTNYESPKINDYKDKIINKRTKSNSKTRTLYRTFEESLRKYSD